MARRVRGVLVREGVQTGDGRVIAEGAIEWADLPLPLGWLQQEQHASLTDGAVQIGTIDTITRGTGGDVEFTGSIDDAQPDGAEMVRRMEAGTAPYGNRWGISIDPDNWELEVIATDAADAEGDAVLLVASGNGVPLAWRTAAAGDPDPGPEGGDNGVVLFQDRVDSVLERYTRLRIRGATAVAVPAFADAYMELDGAADTAEPAPAEPPAAATASAQLVQVPDRPPAAWFRLPEPEPGAEGMLDVYGMPAQELLVEQPDGGLAVPLTITDDGLVFGHAARWGQCHVGYPGTCITAPESLAAYAHFHHGQVVCDDGAAVATGTLTMGCDHAAAELRAPEARDHYAHSGLAWADVRATNGALGVWVCGALRPDVTDAQLRVLRASSLSGDWRRIGTGLEFIGALAVNVPGFPIAREQLAAAGLARLPDAALAASAWVEDGRQVSLVASGVVHRCPECQRRAMATRRAELTPEAQALLAAGQDRMLDLLQRIELRTRHLAPAAAEHALARIRR